MSQKCAPSKKKKKKKMLKMRHRHFFSKLCPFSFCLKFVPLKFEIKIKISIFLLPAGRGAPKFSLAPTVSFPRYVSVNMP